MKLHLAKDLALPLDAVTQTFAIFGKRGSGKSNGATVLVEELLTANLPIVVLDPVDAWWGLKASFNGKGPGFPVYVFGGPHGDLPLESTAGALIADMVAKEHLSVVLSMKEWGVAERARFVTDFAKRLLQVNTEPVHMVLEEADAFIPQRPAKGEEAMLGAMDRLVRWGRQSGVGCTIVTQRSAKVNKDVTTQAETLIAFRTTGPQDREAIDAWIKYHAGDEKRQEVLETLPTLPNGTAWVWSPEWLGVLKQVAVRRRQTFDSAATPKVGQKPVQPKKLAAVDLERLRTQMAETVEKAKADDPRELRKTIAELRKELAGAQQKVADPQQKVARRVEVPVLKDSQVKRLETVLTRMTAEANRHGKAMALFWGNLDEVSLALLNAMRSVAAGPTPPPPVPRPQLVTPAPRRSPVARANAADNGFDGTALRIIDTIAMLNIRGIDPNREAVARWLGIHPNGGRYLSALAWLRANGHLDGFRLTPAGMTHAHEPTTGPQGVRMALKDGTALRSFEVLVAIYPKALTREALAEALGIHPNGGRFLSGLAWLRQMGVITERSPISVTEGALQ